ncbi:hypothetical protein [Streptomyces sp. NPDC085479]|uniref:hypothetical protein n=1 Tax=Streptomyces sp. NPDC085479 TaxID=3365726 RepID=UPI0037D69048
MDALSGVRRVWSGARSRPQSPSAPPAAPRLRAVGGRVGLVVPPRDPAPVDATADMAAGVGAENADSGF